MPITIRWAWFSGIPGTLPHYLFPKESYARFAANDFPAGHCLVEIQPNPMPDWITADILAKLECWIFGGLGLSRQATPQKRQCVLGLCVMVSLCKNKIFCFLVEPVFQCGCYIIKLRFLLSAAGKTDLSPWLVTTILSTVISLYFI